jgi:replicative DNA helicase
MSTNAVAFRPAEPAQQPGYRVMPHNTEAEQGLLGAILTNNKAYERVSEFLKAEHFYDPLHQRIFSAVDSLINQGRIADPVTLKGFFEKDPDLGGVGAAAYLAELAAQVVSVVNAEHYGRAIHDLFLRRRLIDIGEETVNEAYDQKVEVDGITQIEEAEKKLFELASLGDVKGGFVSFYDSLKVVIQHAEVAFKRDTPISGVTTGLIDMDRKLGGLHPSDLLILAGRPSMGKTSLAVNMAFNAAKAYLSSNGKEGAGVAFFSLEMSADQLAGRVLADEAQVPSEKIRRGDLRTEDFQRFAEATQLVGRAPFYIDDTPALSINAVRTRSRRLARSVPSGIGLIVVDYLQLLRGSSSTSENRVQEISEITRGLKAIAKELNVPVVALSQLSRAVEQREDKRPQLSDLRESGSIEQDADVVMFVFREQYYLERAEPARRPDEGDDKFNDRYQAWQQRCEEVHNTAEVIIAKQRHGPIGTVRLHFEGQYTKFSNLDPHHSGGSPFDE